VKSARCALRSPAGTACFYAALFGWEFHEYAPGFHRAPLPGGLIAAVQGFVVQSAIVPDFDTETNLASVEKYLPQ